MVLRAHIYWLSDGFSRVRKRIRKCDLCINVKNCHRSMLSFSQEVAFKNGRIRRILHEGSVPKLSM
jgi:hypothetical protein